jgi:hypothetical protein
MMDRSVLYTNAVMAGLVPAIHDLTRGTKDVDARDRRQVYAVCEQTAMPGHDDAERIVP